MHWRYFSTLALVLFIEVSDGCSRREGTSRQTIPPAGGSAFANSTKSVAATPPVPPSEERFPLKDGRTAVVDSDNHVVFLAVDGGATSESWCGVNGINYRQARAFLAHVIELVGASDKTALAELVSFPLRAVVIVKDRAEFLRRYDQLFPPSGIAAISRADPAALFCRNGAFALGDGEIWAAPDDTGAYRVTTVNPPVLKRRR